MRVWITRSQPGADRLAVALEAAGYEPVVASVTGVEMTGAEVPAGDFDRVFFLSEHAVRSCVAAARFAGTAVYAVGAATADALAGLGVAAVSPTSPGSDALLEHPELENVAGEAVLVVAGEGGRKDLRDELSARGAAVREYLCYQRIQLQIGKMAFDDIDAIVVGSQDGFRTVARLWFDAGGSPSVPVLTPSTRVSGLAETLGFRRVVTCDGASSEAIIAGLSGLALDQKSIR